jgi:hypothetical protein
VKSGFVYCVTDAMGDDVVDEALTIAAFHAASDCAAGAPLDREFSRFRRSHHQAVGP